ncbi:hypothetical protein [Haloarchaeobius sp. TZWWS8]|uniref:hypothetical protein n=1 Tax=Haloarchaeobius sp. TZWWS8 TaxID=3446121 RepID=UPI003EBA8B32
MATRTKKSRVEATGPPLPRVAFELINPLVSLLLRSPLHRFVGGNLVLIRFTGRRSGRVFTTPVGSHRLKDTKSDRLFLLTESGWWRNFDGGRPLEILVDGDWHEGTGTAVTDPAEVAGFVYQFIRENGPNAARKLGLRIRGKGVPAPEELEPALAGRVLIRCDLEEAVF